MDKTIELLEQIWSDRVDEQLKRDRELRELSENIEWLAQQIADLKEAAK